MDEVVSEAERDHCFHNINSILHWAGQEKRLNPPLNISKHHANEGLAYFIWNKVDPVYARPSFYGIAGESDWLNNNSRCEAMTTYQWEFSPILLFIFIMSTVVNLLAVSLVSREVY